MLEGPGAWARSGDGVIVIKISYSVEHLEDNQTFSVAKIYSLLNCYCVWYAKNTPLSQTLLYILVSIFFMCLLIAAACWFINLLGSSIRGNVLITTIASMVCLTLRTQEKLKVVVEYRAKCWTVTVIKTQELCTSFPAQSLRHTQKQSWLNCLHVFPLILCIISY